MFKLLIVCATFPEGAFLSEKVKKAVPGTVLILEKNTNLQMDLLVTGVGITATTHYLTKVFSGNRYHLALNIGICGSLDPDIIPVRVVNITEDRFADFGAENGNEFLDVFDMGLTLKNEKPFQQGKLRATYDGKPDCLKVLPKVKGITVQKVHGSNDSARKAFSRYGAVMESMEGAAFFYVCRMEKIPCLQIRSVSNKVEKRNRKNWKVKEALDALAGFTGLLLLEIKSKYG
jgi:futalosine hydrolase